jgi:ribA/ribD-fused uncharacterized protein
VRCEGGRKKQGPSCTDNFQVKPFDYEGAVYFSCEQAYQAYKFEAGRDRDRIRAIVPFAGERESSHGMRCWSAGQTASGQMRHNWDVIKVQVMLEVNRAKYMQHSDLISELLSTENVEIIGGPSTSWRLHGQTQNWSKWNGLIQMRLREEFTQPDVRRAGSLEALVSTFDAYLEVLETMANGDVIHFPGPGDVNKPGCEAILEEASSSAAQADTGPSGALHGIEGLKCSPSLELDV